MKECPLVSVIIPTFQRSEYLIRAIESVIKQTYENIEIIVVDDNDGENEYRSATRNNLNKYIVEGKLIYIENKRNRGNYFARNIGINNSNGKYIAFLDDDDEWLPSKIAQQIELFEKLDDSYGIIGAYWKIINEFDNKELIRRLNHKGDLSKILARNHFAPPSCIVVKRKYINLVQGFDENFRWRGDIEFYYRLSFVCKFDFVEEVLVNYYQHPNALSTNFEKKLNAVIQYLDKHGDTTKKNKLPWSEINEHLAELYAVNGQKRKAAKHFGIAIANRPFHLATYGKVFYAVFLSKEQYKKKRNFK